MSVGLDTLSLLFYVLLLAWFTLDLIGIRRLVTRDPWRSSSGLLEMILVIILGCYLVQWDYVVFPSLITLGIWGYLQYTSHWRYLLFGAPEARLKRYSAWFGRMYRFFPESHHRVVPDAYHTILGLLLSANLLLVTIQALVFVRERTG